MTLDRIDNSLGHLQSNVLPSCERCNMVRRDMPFPAWLVVSKGMKEAYESGLFEGWVGGPHDKMRKEPAPERPGLAKFKANYPTDVELAEKLQVQTAVSIASELGISSSALKKHCKSKGIPTPGRGHWTKRRNPCSG